MNTSYNVCSPRQVGRKTYWTTVGVAFENKNGPGFSVILNAVPVAENGQITLVILPRKPRNEPDVEGTELALGA